MSFRTRTIVLAGLLFGAAGCATINYDSGTLERMVAMNRVAAPASYQRLGDFESKQRAIFLVEQLITVRDADIESAVQRELGRSGGDAVINLRIREEYDVVDVLVAVLVGGFLNTRSITLEGDIVRWRTGMTDDDFQRVGLVCRALVVPDADTSRTGHLCIPQAALDLASAP